MAMAADTLAAALEARCGPVCVLTADASVSALARSLGAETLRDRGRGLNAELYAALTHPGPDTGVAVLLGDLPAARGDDLREVLRLVMAQPAAPHSAPAPGAYLPDWEGTGTALVAFAPGVGERAVAFGAGSARRHHELGLAPVGLDLARLRCDVDTPAAWDLAVELGLGAATAAARTRLLARR